MKTLITTTTKLVNKYKFVLYFGSAFARGFVGYYGVLPRPKAKNYVDKTTERDFLKSDWNAVGHDLWSATTIY